MNFRHSYTYIILLQSEDDLKRAYIALAVILGIFVGAIFLLLLILLVVQLHKNSSQKEKFVSKAFYLVIFLNLLIADFFIFISSYYSILIALVNVSIVDSQ